MMEDIKRSRLALRVTASSVLIILIVYFIMQTLSYFRDNILLGVSDLSALPAAVFGFIGMYVLPPMVVFGIILYVAALPLERTLERLRSGESVDAATVEKTRLKILSFSRLVLIFYLLGFALGFLVLVIVESGIAGIAAPHRIVVLFFNLSTGFIFASAQSSINNVLFKELRNRLALREIGKRKRQLRGTLKQVLLAAAMAYYVWGFLAFNLRDANAYHNLQVKTLQTVATGQATREDAAAAFRASFASAFPTAANRPGFRIDSVSLPWDLNKPYETIQFHIALLCFLFGISSVIFVQIVISKDTRDQVAAITDRIRDVTQGDGDLRKRLNLQAMDEYGALSESVNSLLDRFVDIVSRIAAAATQTRAGAAAIDRMLAEAEAKAGSTVNAVLDLTRALDSQATESRGLTDAVRSVDMAAKAVAVAVEAQRDNAADTAAAMEEMFANIRSVESMTSRSGQLSEDLAERGSAGGAAVADTEAAIAAIEASASDVLSVLRTLSKIAGDTNLLAMNAAIEAAHAGDQGAGFAVVADEVRALASTAAAQTKTIRNHLKDMAEKVRRGVERSAASDTAFRGLSEGISQAAAISQEIEEAMKEQSAGTKSVESALNRVIENAESIKVLIEKQGAETIGMAERLDTALSRLSELALSSRVQAEAVRELDTSFAAVRKEVDSNMSAVDKLNRELSTLKS